MRDRFMAFADDRLNNPEQNMKVREKSEGFAALALQFSLRERIFYRS